MDMDVGLLDLGLEIKVEVGLVRTLIRFGRGKVEPGAVERRFLPLQGHRTPSIQRVSYIVRWCLSSASSLSQHEGEEEDTIYLKAKHVPDPPLPPETQPIMSDPIVLSISDQFERERVTVWTGGARWGGWRERGGGRVLEERGHSWVVI